MQLDGTWWYLVGEEPFNEETTRQFAFVDGELLDGRTDERRGSYTVEGDRLTIDLAEGVQIVAKVPVDEPTLISATMIEPQADGETLSHAAMLNRTEAREARVVPLFPETA